MACLDLNIYIYTTALRSGTSTSEFYACLRKHTSWMRSENLASANVRITTFWDVTLCSLVDRYRYFQRNILPSTLKTEAEGFFKEHWY
jgi:hypothetical protein